MKRALLVGVVLLGAVTLLAHGQTEPVSGEASLREKVLMARNEALMGDVTYLACNEASLRHLLEDIEAVMRDELDAFDAGARSEARERILFDDCYRTPLSPVGVAATNRARELFGLEPFGSEPGE